MRSAILLAVCLTSLSAAGLAQQGEASRSLVVSRRAKQALGIYDSSMRKINEAALREASKAREQLASDLKRARAQATSQGDTEDAQAIAGLETTLDFAVPVMAPSRAYWEHPKGYFQLLAGEEWIEKTPTGEAVLYRQTERTHEYIELTTGEKNQQTLIRLYRDRSVFQKPGQKAFTSQFKGQFALPPYLR